MKRAKQIFQGWYQVGDKYRVEIDGDYAKIYVHHNDNSYHYSCKIFRHKSIAKTIAAYEERRDEFSNYKNEIK
jgi:hypothetical protein